MHCEVEEVEGGKGEWQCKHCGTIYRNITFPLRARCRKVAGGKGRRKKMSFREKLVSLKDSLASFAGDPSFVSAEEYERRMAICETCPQLVGTSCNYCGCGLMAKARGRAFCCPDGLWGGYGLSDVTVVVTHFLRPHCLERFLQSWKENAACDGVTVSPIDTEGNLSAGRNRGVAAAKTDVIMIAEDDFVAEKPVELSRALDVLSTDETIGVVCGSLVHNGRLVKYAGDINRFRDTLVFDQYRPFRWQISNGRYPYRLIDMGWNFFLARSQCLKDCPWDEELPVHEHAAWFWKLKQQGKWRVAHVPGMEMTHSQDRTDPEYMKHRKRTSKLIPTLQRKYGFSRLVSTKGDAAGGGLPNVVLMGVGHSNTSITARQLGQLGWNLHDADNEWFETPAINSLNDEVRDTNVLDKKVAAAVLSGMPEPWVIKDPRFCVTLSRWYGVLAQYEPTLLWITKPAVHIMESARRRGEAFGVENKIEQLYSLAEGQFRDWPWGKFKIEAKRISEAVRMFDVDRTRWGGGQ